MIRKIVLRIGVPSLLVLMAFNAYLAVKHLQQMQELEGLSAGHAAIQREISAVLQDFVDMETGQRGYLLTDDTAYLQPYTDAKGRIGTDLAALRVGLADRDERERSMESQLEALAISKQGEVQRTLSLRQQGYRHRAFTLVDTNEGKEYMDKARELLSSLSAAESTNSLNLEKDRQAILRKAVKETILVNLILLVLTGGLFWLFSYHEKILERHAAEGQRSLAVSNSHLEKLTSALSYDFQDKILAIEMNAQMLLKSYGGFLPRHGQACAEQVKEQSAQLELLRQDLVGESNLSVNDKAA